MNDLTPLFQIVAAIALVTAPAILMNRLLDGGGGGTLADLFAIPLDQPWPRGVQEEESPRWRIELLHRPAAVRDGCLGGQRDAMLPVNRSTP